MNKTTLAVLVLALAAPAGAVRESQRQEMPEEAFAVAQALAAQARRAQALSMTLIDMNDGPEASGRVLRLLEEKKITVGFATQAEPVKRGLVDGRDAILLSDALPPRLRVYAPLIAAEAAKLMYADMPECAELAYMRMATAARVFAEMGGDFKALPLVDGDLVDSVRDAVGLWADEDVQKTLDALAKLHGVEKIPVLEQQAVYLETADALYTANKRFVDFLYDERYARVSAGLRGRAN